MKLSRDRVKQFDTKLQELCRDRIPQVHNASKAWLDAQENRGYVDQDHIKYLRDRLENQLDKCRAELGELYDFMRERGLSHVG